MLKYPMFPFPLVITHCWLFFVFFAYIIFMNTQNISGTIRLTYTGQMKQAQAYFPVGLGDASLAI